MNRIERLDLTAVVSLAAVTAALLVGWIATSQAAMPHAPREAQPNPLVTLTPDGRMKLEVVAPRESALSLTADGRMKLTVVADRIQDVAAAPAAVPHS